MVLLGRLVFLYDFALAGPFLDGVGDSNDFLLDELGPPYDLLGLGRWKGWRRVAYRKQRDA